MLGHPEPELHQIQWSVLRWRAATASGGIPEAERAVA